MSTENKKEPNKEVFHHFDGQTKITCKQFEDSLLDVILYGSLGEFTRGKSSKHIMDCASCKRVDTQVRKIFNRVLENPRWGKFPVGSPEKYDYADPRPASKEMQEFGLIYGENFLINSINRALEEDHLKDILTILKKASRLYESELPKATGGGKTPFIPWEAKSMEVGRELDKLVVEAFGGKAQWETLADGEELYCCIDQDEEWIVCPPYSTEKGLVEDLYSEVAKNKSWWLGFDKQVNMWVILDKQWIVIMAGADQATAMCRMLAWDYLEAKRKKSDV